jgi:hypothetical protein
MKALLEWLALAFAVIALLGMLITFAVLLADVIASAPA